MRKSAFIISLLISPYAMAVLSIPGIASPQWQVARVGEDALSKVGLAEFQDEVIDDHDFELNNAQLHEAKVWDLTDVEEKRYVQLMQSRSGLYYQGLRMSPIDILGLNARDDIERLHFAELAAKQEAQKVSQNLAWNNAFHQAYNQLFKDTPVVGDFDPSPYSPYAHHPIQLQEGEAIYLFIKSDDAIKTIVLQLIDAIIKTPNTRLHILFVDMDSDAIQLWANRQQIPPNLVGTQQITFGQGGQQYQALKLKKKTTPLLLIAKGNVSQVVDLGRF